MVCRRGELENRYLGNSRCRLLRLWRHELHEVTCCGVTCLDRFEARAVGVHTQRVKGEFGGEGYVAKCASTCCKGVLIVPITQRSLSIKCVST